MNETEILARRILNSNDWGIAANELLSEFHRGRPVEQLCPLLRSREPLVVRVASFIADELGSNASTIIDDLFRLINFPDRHVRGNVIGSLLNCADAAHPSQIASVVSLLNDLDWPIRWKTMEFLSRAASHQLRAASQHFQRLDATTDHAAGLNWLLSEDGRDSAQIDAWMSSESPLSRKYGVIAATRIASLNGQPLRSATSSSDEDVQRFADSMLQIRLASV